MANYIRNNGNIGGTLRTLAVTGMVASLAAVALGSTGAARAADLEAVYAHVGFPGGTADTMNVAARRPNVDGRVNRR